MRRFPVSLLILVVAVAAVAGGWMLFAKAEHERFVAVDRVNRSRSEIRFSYIVDHTSGRIAREVWSMQNINGHSMASYTAVDRHGTKATFDEQIVGYDVTFLFDKLVQDGIWELETRPFRGSSQTLHVVAISQVADKSQGSHRFQFSDAHYIATEAGREYHIHLDPHKPVPDLVNLQSTSTADPRYEKIVQDFEQFGPPRFKATIAAAKAKLLKG
ncbi:MAG TPA: hypothetical protein VIK27_10500 [Candidatus Aquilonibacter sp.]